MGFRLFINRNAERQTKKHILSNFNMMLLRCWAVLPRRTAVPSLTSVSWETPTELLFFPSHKMLTALVFFFMTTPAVDYT